MWGLPQEEESLTNFSPRMASGKSRSVISAAPHRETGTHSVNLCTVISKLFIVKNIFLKRLWLEHQRCESHSEGRNGSIWGGLLSDLGKPVPACLRVLHCAHCWRCFISSRDIVSHLLGQDPPLLRTGIHWEELTCIVHSVLLWLYSFSFRRHDPFYGFFQISVIYKGMTWKYSFGCYLKGLRCYA